MRIIIYTGKGGVGKTSMAATTACRIAESGKKVLVMSTDQAHSLGDSYDMKLGKEPTRIMDNLDAMEIDTVYESEKSWGNLKNYFKEFLTLKGGSGIEVEELLVFPGLEELFSMFKILEVYESGSYDTIIVDCAPTGETLSLLKYPERLSGLIEKVLPVKRKGIKKFGPIVEKLSKIPMPEDNVFDDFEYEAKRNFTCLYLYHYNVDAVIVNHIYPEQAMEGYFSKWIRLQEEGLKEIEENFSEVPRFYVELQNSEIRTLDVLRDMGSKIYGDTDPDEVLFKKEIYILDKDNSSLKIYLPFAEKDEMNLEQAGGELVVGIRNESRRFPVPTDFTEKEITGAKFEEGYLNICFG